MTADRIAYCAPGRKMHAALALLAAGEQVAELTEHPFLEGYPDVLLVDPSRLPDFSSTPVMPAPDPLERCRMCQGTLRHYPWCALEMPLIMSPGPVVTLSCS